MKTSLSALLLAFTATTAAAAFAFSAAHAAEDDPKLSSLDKSRQIVVQANNQKTDNSKSAPVKLFSRPPKLEDIKVVDKGRETDPVSSGRDEEKTERIEIVDNRQEADPVPSNLDKQIDKVPDQIDEKLFAPQISAETAKVEIPTVFTERQKILFGELDQETQVLLVKNLIEKYGYETLYPTRVASQTTNEHHTSYRSQNYRYQDRSHYRNNYQSSYRNGYRYANQSRYHGSYNRNSYGCSK